MRTQPKYSTMRNGTVELPLDQPLEIAVAPFECGGLILLWRTLSGRQTRCLLDRTHWGESQTRQASSWEERCRATALDMPEQSTFVRGGLTLDSKELHALNNVRQTFH